MSGLYGEYELQRVDAGPSASILRAYPYRDPWLYQAAIGESSLEFLARSAHGHRRVLLCRVATSGTLGYHKVDGYRFESLVEKIVTDLAGLLDLWVAPGILVTRPPQDVAFLSKRLQPPSLPVSDIERVRPISDLADAYHQGCVAFNLWIDNWDCKLDNIVLTRVRQEALYHIDLGWSCGWGYDALGPGCKWDRLGYRDPLFPRDSQGDRLLPVPAFAVSAGGCKKNEILRTAKDIEILDDVLIWDIAARASDVYCGKEASRVAEMIAERLNYRKGRLVGWIEEILREPRYRARC